MMAIAPLIIRADDVNLSLQRVRRAERLVERAAARVSRLERPFAKPNASPIPPPTTKPESASSVDTPMFWAISPNRASRKAAATTPDGAGGTFGGTSPSRDAISQTTTSATGSSRPIAPCGMRFAVTRPPEGGSRRRDGRR